ncbi:MAG: GNAT family N-acetyltransferase [Marinifilaceae bacterium]
MFRFCLIPLDELEKIQHDSIFPGNQYLWVRSWLSVFRKLEDNDFGYSKEEIVVLGFQNEKLVAVLPMVKLQRKYLGLFSLTFLEFLGQQWSSFGNDIIWVDQPGIGFLNELINWLKKNLDFHFIFFKNLPSNSILKSGFRFYKYEGVPFLDLRKYSDYDSFSKIKYTRKQRENLRRGKRLAEKDGIVVTESVETINEDIFEEIKQVAKSKSVDGKSYLYGHPEKERFYKLLFDIFHSQVVWVKFNGRAVAYCINFYWRGIKFGVDTAYDRAFRNYNLGNWCFDNSVKNSFQRRDKIYSFGPGFDSYKFKFTDALKEYFMCYDWKPCFKSFVALPYFKYLLQRRERRVRRMLQKTGYYG